MGQRARYYSGYRVAVDRKVSASNPHCLSEERLKIVCGMNSHVLDVAI